MQAVAARWVLTDKEQPLLGAVLIGSVPAHRTGFRGVIRIDLDCQGPRECGLVADERMQFSKGPLRVDPIGFAGLWRDSLRALAILLALAFSPRASALEYLSVVPVQEARVGAA